MPFREVNGAEPVAAPVAAQDRATLALAAAAEALLAVANALRSAPPASVRTCPDITVAEAVNEFLIAKARAGRSDRYLRQVRVSLSSFAKGRAGVRIGDVTVADVEKWLFNRGWKARTMRGYLADVRTLFNFAVRRGHLASSAAAAVELPQDDSQGAAPGILTPAQVAQVMDQARGTPDVMRHLAIRFFAGVRSAEAHRLSEADLLLDRGYVQVPAVKAKTRRRRLVKVQPVLAAWLALGGELRPMHPQTVRAVVHAAGVTMPKNGTRHSFCSYHLAAFGSASRTALEAGHSEAMLFAHYRELVTELDAKAFWELTPEKCRNIVAAL